MKAERKEGEGAVEFWECPGLPSGDQDDSVLRSLVLGRNVKELISLLWSVIGCESPGEIEYCSRGITPAGDSGPHSPDRCSPKRSQKWVSTVSTTPVCYSPQNQQTKPTVLRRCWNRR